MDAGRKETDALLDEMEKRIREEYLQAEKEIQKKLDDYLARFEAKDKKKLADLEDGKISQADYDQWRMGQMAIGERWRDMKDVISQDLHNSNNIAKNIINGYMPDVYASGHKPVLDVKTYIYGRIERNRVDHGFTPFFLST